METRVPRGCKVLRGFFELCRVAGLLESMQMPFGIVLQTLIRVSLENHAVNLEGMVQDVFSDGSGGAEKALVDVLPNARHHRDLQRAA